MLPLVFIACTLVPFQRHELDRIEQEEDTIAPAVPVVDKITITRGSARGCGETNTECDELGIVDIEIHSQDDRTPPERIGWHIEVTGDNAPTLDIPAYDVEANPLVLTWTDGASDEQEPVDFNIRIVAVDLAGNQSTTGINVPVKHGGNDGGCGCRPAARRPVEGPFAVVGLGVLFLLARRLVRAGSRSRSR